MERKMERKWRDKEDEMDEGRCLGKWEGNGETKKMEWMKELVTKENGEEMVRQGDEMDEGIGD